MGKLVVFLYAKGINQFIFMAKYGKKAQEKVHEAMHAMNKGKLKMRKSGKKVTSKKQSIAIALSEAREAGGKVPT
ncbi:hypothetical protein BH09PAT2_BH09PAT2_06050 [soil metagenome]